MSNNSCNNDSGDGGEVTTLKNGLTAKELVDRAFEAGGKRQIATVLCLAFVGLFVGINHSITSFYIWTPKYSCRGSNLSACDPQCTTGIEFSGDDESVVTEFELVCERRYLSALLNTLYFAGVMVGATVGGQLADKFGRRVVTFWTLYIQATIGAALYFVTGLEMFIILRAIQGFFIQALASAVFTMLSEFSSIRIRTITGVLWQCFMAIGLVYLTVAAYFFKNWRTLQLITALPNLLTLFYLCFIPESPRWLLTQGKFEEALKYCRKFNQSLEMTPANETLEESLTSPEKSEMEKSSYFDLFKNAILRKHLIVMSAIFFSVNLSIYGVFFILPNVGGSRYTNYLILAVIEIIACAISFYLLKSFGRIRSLTGYQLGNAAILIGIAVFSIFLYDKSWTQNIVTLFAQLSVGVGVMSFSVMVILSCELFPTSCRGYAYGIASSWARIGAVVAPQMILLGEKTSDNMPIIIYAGFLILTGLSTQMLPETQKKQLPNTIDEANRMWSKPKS